MTVGAPLFRSPFRGLFSSPLALNPGPSLSALALITAKFSMQMDFVNNVMVGGTQTYTSNIDGDFLRDALNFTASHAEQAGPNPVVALGSSGLRRTNMGVWATRGNFNSLLWSSDLTNAAWVISNGTDITATKNVPGALGTANSGSKLVWNVDNGTILQALTIASSVRNSSVFIKRLTGTDPLQMTQDGTTFTSLAEAVATTRLYLASATITNPSVGFRCKAGNSFEVSFVQNEPGQWPSPPVLTTTAAVSIGRCRPTSIFGNLSPIVPVKRGAHAWFVQGRSRVNPVQASPLACNVFTSDVVSICSVNTSNNGSVGYQGAVTATGAWKAGTPDLSTVNKTAGQISADGTLLLSCNGVGATAAGGALGPTIDHCDLWTNGAAQVCGDGPVERYMVTTDTSFTLADLNLLTA